MSIDKVVNMKGNPVAEKIESLQQNLAASFISFEKGVYQLRQIAEKRPETFRTMRIDYKDGGVDSVPSIIKRIQKDLEFISITSGLRR